MTKKNSIIYLSLALVLSFGFNSCKKEESKTTSIPDYTGCRASKVILSEAEIQFSYTADGKLSKYEIYETGQSAPADGYYYTYSGNKVEYKDMSEREIGVYTLNSSGNAVSLEVGYYNSQDPTVLTSAKSETFKYNSEGKLIERKVVISSASGSSTTTYTNVWSGGNLVTEITVSNSGSSSSVSHEYYPDKSNAMNFISKLLEFTGNSSKNLLKQSKETATGGVIETFTYEYDSGGRVTKMKIEDDQGGIEETSFEMSCP